MANLIVRSTTNLNLRTTTTTTTTHIHEYTHNNIRSDHTRSAITVKYLLIQCIVFYVLAAYQYLHSDRTHHLHDDAQTSTQHSTYTAHTYTLSHSCIFDTILSAPKSRGDVSGTDICWSPSIGLSECMCWTLHTAARHDWMVWVSVKEWIFYVSRCCDE